MIRGFSGRYSYIWDGQGSLAAKRIPPIPFRSYRLRHSTSCFLLSCSSREAEDIDFAHGLPAKQVPGPEVTRLFHSLHSTGISKKAEYHQPAERRRVIYTHCLRRTPLLSADLVPLAEATAFFLVYRGMLPTLCTYIKNIPLLSSRISEIKLASRPQ